MLAISDVLVNMTRTPIHLEEDPVFTLLVNSDQNGSRPVHVHIQVAEHPTFDPDYLLWNLQEDRKDLSHIPYGGASLKAHRRYHIRASVMDSLGQQSPAYSTFFETAFYSESGWNASFIRADYPQEEEGPVPCFHFTRSFSVSNKVTGAKLYISAKGVYEAWLNGVRVSEEVLTPGWTSYRHFLAYQSYDVTGLVRQGQNNLSVLVGDGWYKGFLSSRWLRNYYGSRRELICQLHLHCSDGPLPIVQSDGQFHWKLSNIFESELYRGEVCDGSFEPHPSRGDPGLHPVVIGEKPSPGYLRPSAAPLMKYSEAVSPVRLLTTPKGEQVLDFGWVLSGVVEVAVSGSKGDRVILQCGDTLDPEGNFYTDNLELFSLGERARPVLQRIEYRCSGESEEIYRPHFTCHGFRYVHVIQYPGALKLEDFQAIEITSFHRQTGFFSCGQEEVNTLFRNIVNTQRATFLDLPIAGPQRAERLGWTGDAQLIAYMACHNMFDAVRFFSKWLDNLTADQREDGQVGTMIPYVQFGDMSNGEDDYSASAAWGDAAVIVPWQLYRFTGNRALLARYCPAARRYVEYMRRSGEDERLFSQGFSFGDWFALDGGEDAYPGKTDTAMIACFYYYHSTILLSRMLRELGQTDEAGEYALLAQTIRAALATRYFTPDGTLVDATQTGCAMALHFGIAPKPNTVANQLEELIHTDGDRLVTGFIGASMILPVLCETGREMLAYDLLLRREYPSWIYPITQGATAIWEHWNSVKPDGSLWSPNMNSFCHLTFGSVGEWLYGWVLGLQQAEGTYGYRHFLFRPAVDRRLGHAWGGFRSIYGEIRASWRFQAEMLELSLQVPVGTEAMAALPWVEDPVSTADALLRQKYQRISITGQTVECLCGSGLHRFRYRVCR